MEQSIVSSRVALLLRSAEIKLSFRRFVRMNISSPSDPKTQSTQPHAFKSLYSLLPVKAMYACARAASFRIFDDFTAVDTWVACGFESRLLSCFTGFKSVAVWSLIRGLKTWGFVEVESAGFVEVGVDVASARGRVNFSVDADRSTWTSKLNVTRSRCRQVSLASMSVGIQAAVVGRCGTWAGERGGQKGVRRWSEVVARVKRVVGGGQRWSKGQSKAVSKGQS